MACVMMAYAVMPNVVMALNRYGLYSHGLYNLGTAYIGMAYIIMVYMVMAYIVMAYIAMVYVVMAYIAMVYVVMAYIAMAYIVMAYIVMAYIVMAYVVMAYIVAHSPSNAGWCRLSNLSKVFETLGCQTCQKFLKHLPAASEGQTDTRRTCGTSQFSQGITHLTPKQYPKTQAGVGPIPCARARLCACERACLRVSGLL